jgi:hypothetical protein
MILARRRLCWCRSELWSQQDTARSSGEHSSVPNLRGTVVEGSVGGKSSSVDIDGAKQQSFVMLSGREQSHMMYS